MTRRPLFLLALAAGIALALPSCAGHHPAASPVRTVTPVSAPPSPTATASSSDPAAEPVTSPATRSSPVASPGAPSSVVPLPKDTTPAAGPPPTPVQRITIGRSAKGRTISAIEFGDPTSERRLVVVGCIHGNEQAGIAIARQLERLAPPAGVDVWVIEDLNPDGAAANTRQNANGIDLNRNFPYAWQPLEAPGGLMYSGPAAESEPETQAAVAFLNTVRPTVTIWFHQHMNLVDLSGGDASIEQRYASMVGLPTQQLQRYPGSVTSWENQTFPGSTAFVVELPAGSLSVETANRYAVAALNVA